MLDVLSFLFVGHFLDSVLSNFSDSVQKTPTYEICPCCGVEWGNEDYTLESRIEYRNKWLAAGAKWFEPQKKPANWNLEEQLKNADNETDR